MSTCPSCHAEQPAEARFCSNCGARLATPPPAAQERKLVSVLFADLVGFTSRSERLDVEDVHDTLAAYHRLLRNELERFGGTVEKFIGDAVMALFGAPTAHEDDAERAVRAAAAIQAAVSELRQDRADFADLHVRVGVTTGEALVSVGAHPERGEGMASGDVVNTAARLQTAAPVDGILVDDATRRATARMVNYAEAEPVDAKGKARPVAAWGVVALRGRAGTDVVQEERTPLVGRDEEVRVLAHSLERASRESQPQLVTLIGVPGIGKSRLVWELYRRVDAGRELVTWRQGRCLAYGDGVTYWALGEMVKAQTGVLDTDPADVRAEKLQRAVEPLLRDSSERIWVEANLRPLVGIDVEGGDQAEQFGAWRRFFEALAAERPLVLVFEDLHWAGDELLDFIEHLVDWASDVPLLVLATARPELLERRSSWGGGTTNSTTIAVSPLSDPDSARLVSALLEQVLMPADVQEQILARAAGNPLYAHEYVRMLIERGELVRGACGWALRPDADLAPPETLRAVIAARLDALPAEEKRALQDAAVMGKVFWLGAVAALDGGERSPLSERLHRLDRKEFVRRQRDSSLAGDVEYAFRHVLVRDVAYAQLTRPQRARKHMAAAQFIERISDNRADRAELLANHYLQALEVLPAGERSDAAAAASRALRAAADRAEELHAYAAVRRYAGMALGVAEAPLERSEQLRVELQALIAEMRLDDVLPERLSAVADELASEGDVERAVQALGEIGVWLGNNGRIADAEQALVRALDLHGDGPPTAASTFALGALGTCLILGLGQVERGVRMLEAAVEQTELLDLDDQRAAQRVMLAQGRMQLDDVRCQSDFDEAVRLAVGQPSQWSPVVLLNAGESAVRAGKLDEAERLQGLGEQAAERLGMPFHVEYARAAADQLNVLRGRWTEIESAFETAARSAGGQLERLCRLATVELLARRPAAGAAALASARSLTASVGDAGATVYVASMRARALVEGREYEVAKLALGEALAGMRDGVAQWGPMLATAAHAARRLGEADAVEAILDRARLETPWLDAARAVCRGDLEEALAVYRKIGSVPDQVLTLRELAEDLRAAGRDADATAPELEAERLVAGLRPPATPAQVDVAS